MAASGNEHLPEGMTAEEAQTLTRLGEIAFEAMEWVNRNAHNDYARSQMMRAVWFTLYGEDLEDAQ